MRLDSLAMGHWLARIYADKCLGRGAGLVEGARGVAAVPSVPSVPAAPAQQRREAAEGNVGGEFQRAVLCGPKGSGKSVLLLQAMTWALQRGWLVINIPNGIPLALKLSLPPTL